MNVSIPGTGSAVLPASVVNVGMMSMGNMMGTNGPMDSHSFQWMKTSIPAGTTETVYIYFQTSAGTAVAGYRDVMIDLLLN